jgi:hypothetical protein
MTIRSHPKGIHTGGKGILPLPLEIKKVSQRGTLMGLHSPFTCFGILWGIFAPSPFQIQCNFVPPHKVVYFGYLNAKMARLEYLLKEPSAEF